LYKERAMPLRSLLVILVVGCGGSPGPLASMPPTTVAYGQTSVIVWVNPRINDANTATVPPPGTARANVVVDLANESIKTGSDGIAVLANVPSGAQTLTFSGAVSGSLPITLADNELREIAVAVDASGAHLMADLHYRFGDAVVDVMPTMTESQINQALNASNQIVLFHGGTYTGNYLFSGSQVTLFGEGLSGGAVTLVGNITVNGSNNRIRGTRIQGDLSIDGGSFGLTSSEVTGAMQLAGGSAIFIDNDLCRGGSLNGGSNTMLENLGLASLAVDSSRC
jgi:hypothetical protein